MKTTKKYIAVLLALAMVLALTGCGASEAVCMKNLKNFAAEDGDTLSDTAAESAEEAEGVDPAIEEPAAEGTGTADAAEANTSSPSSTQPKKPAFGKKPTQTSAPAGTQSNQSQPQPPAEGGHQPSQPQNNGGTQSGSTGNTQSGGQPSQPQKHEHYWNPVYDTVHHEEKGHYENVEVQAAWDEPQYEYWLVCSACGAKFHGDAIDMHIIDNHGGHASYSGKQFVSGYIHHDAVYEKQWVVDQSAWDEQVITGYECICGEKKSA